MFMMLVCEKIIYFLAYLLLKMRIYQSFIFIHISSIFILRMLFCYSYLRIILILVSSISSNVNQRNCTLHRVYIQVVKCSIPSADMFYFYFLVFYFYITKNIRIFIQSLVLLFISEFSINICLFVLLISACCVVIYFILDVPYLNHFHSSKNQPLSNQVI